MSQETAPVAQCGSGEFEETRSLVGAEVEPHRPNLLAASGGEQIVARP
ncbi:hypothetical protein [Nocardia asteroides]|nr:hypothetical protein [Nocardia asteroides]UGT51910.1 hypothetical protein LT345_15705 [Nocardia asteroides]